jgi:hypothetical protein
MRESVSGRGNDEGVNHADYAEDMVVGERAEDDFIEYQKRVAGVELARWHMNNTPAAIPEGLRCYLMPMQVKPPDLFDPKEGRRIEVKWRYHAMFYFNMEQFYFRMSRSKWASYVFLDQTEMPCFIALVVESGQPSASDIATAKKLGREVPAVYPNGLFKGRVRYLDRMVNYDNDWAWVPMEAMAKVTTIENYRRVLER